MTPAPSVYAEIAAIYEKARDTDDLARKGDKSWFVWKPEWGGPTTPDGRQRAWLKHFCGGKRSLLGAYFLDENSCCRRGVIDIDGHHSHQTPDEDLEKLVFTIENLKHLWYMVARSRGGKGYHVEFLSDEPVPGPYMVAFLRGLVRAAGLPPATEVFPKAERKTSPFAGGQVARPGNRAWFQETGGSTYIDTTTGAPIPMGRWPEEIRRAAQNFDIEHLKDACAAIGVALPDLREAENVGPELPKSFGIQEVEAFLRGNGLVFESKAYHSQRWTWRFRLPECPFWARHSPPDKPTAQDYRGGAAILFDERSGKIGFKCFHAHCEGKCWRDFRNHFDPGRAFHFTPPRVEPTTNPHRISNDDRDDLIAEAEELFPDKRRRTHFENVVNCAESHGPVECPKSHPEGWTTWVCEGHNIEPYCGHQHADTQRRFIEENWTEGAAVATFRAPDGMSPGEALKYIIGVRRKLRQAYAKGLFYGWFVGIYSGAFVAPPRKLSYLLAARDHLAALGIAIDVHLITAAEAARAVSDVVEEPSKLFHELAKKKDYAAIAAFPYLQGRVVKRSDHGRKSDGDELPWLNFSAKRRRLVEESRKRRGVDFEHCSHVDVVDGEEHVCGLPLTVQVMDSRDGEILYTSKPNEVRWNVRRSALACVAAKRRQQAAARLGETRRPTEHPAAARGVPLTT